MIQLPSSVTITEKRMEDGLQSFRAITFLVLWYFFSGCTLFLNKYILSYLNGDPTVLGKYNYHAKNNLYFYFSTSFVLGASQMTMTTICGFVQLYIPCGMYKQPIQRSKRPPNFYIHMSLVGCTR